MGGLLTGRTFPREAAGPALIIRDIPDETFDALAAHRPGQDAAWKLPWAS
jgi:hypothetical protein